MSTVISVPANSIWAFLATLLTWVEYGSVLYLFAFTYNFRTYLHERLLKRLDNVLAECGLSDLEFEGEYV